MQMYKLNKGYYLKVMTPEDDLEPIIKVGQEAIEASPYKDLVSLTPEYALGALQELIEKGIEETMALCLFTPENAPCGLLLGFIQSDHPLFVDRKIGTELLWYVQKEHRGADSLKMLKAFEEWCRLNDCSLCSMSHFKGIEEERMLEIVYKRSNYVPVESGYIKELN